MKESKTATMIRKLENGETVVCPRCQKGVIIYQKVSNQKFPDVYCNNEKCKAKIHFN